MLQLLPTLRRTALLAVLLLGVLQSVQASSATSTTILLACMPATACCAACPACTMRSPPIWPWPYHPSKVLPPSRRIASVCPRSPAYAPKPAHHRRALKPVTTY